MGALTLYFKCGSTDTSHTTSSDCQQAGPPGPVGEKGMRGDPGLRGAVGEPELQGPPAGGAVYTRWGRTNLPHCPENSPPLLW